jgi:hypothetical protein
MLRAMARYMKMFEHWCAADDCAHPSPLSIRNVIFIHTSSNEWELNEQNHSHQGGTIKARQHFHGSERRK